ncbi:MAG: hypothetical protein AB7J32_08870 [Pseudonocardia sp.]
MSDETSVPAPETGRPDPHLAPGGPRAVARGCLCSVLANAAYRAGAADEPLVDPRCPLHTTGAPSD